MGRVWRSGVLPLVALVAVAADTPSADTPSAGTPAPETGAKAGQWENYVVLSLHPGIGRGADIDAYEHRETFEARGVGGGIGVRIFDTGFAADHPYAFLAVGLDALASRSLRDDEHSISTLEAILSLGIGPRWQISRHDSVFVGPEFGLGWVTVFDHDRVLDRYHGGGGEWGIARFAVQAGGITMIGDQRVLLWGGYEWRYTGVDFAGEKGVREANYLSRGFCAGIGFGF